jgi:collagen type VII alpha
MLQVYQIAVPNIMEEGFSALISSVSSSIGLRFQNWTVDSPNFGSTNFNTTTGIYTVPATGRYSIEAIINYDTDLAIDASIGVNPFFAVEFTSSFEKIISGLLPLNNISVLALTLRAILGGGAVTLAGEANLTLGDTLGLYYDTNGMTGITLNFSNIVWSVYRIT